MFRGSWEGLRGRVREEEEGKCLVYVALKNLSQGRRRARCQFKHITVVGSPQGGGQRGFGGKGLGGRPSTPPTSTPAGLFKQIVCTEKKAADIITIQSLLGEIAFTRHCVVAAALILPPPSRFLLFSLVCAAAPVCNSVLFNCNAQIIVTVRFFFLNFI